MDMMKARKHNNIQIKKLLEATTPIELEQTKVKMQLAARIEDLITSKGWSKSQFAEKAGKNPSEITKWLSGTQNFTIDILVEISHVIGVDINTLFHKKTPQIVDRRSIVIQIKTDKSPINLKTPTPGNNPFPQQPPYSYNSTIGHL